MNGISNIFIHKVLSLAQVAYYNGVYSSDCLNKYLKQEDRFVIVCTSFCGFYCILFAILSDPEYQDVSNLKMFRHKKLEENDDICIENILKLLNK